MKVFYLQQLWEDVMVGKAQADGGGGGGGEVVGDGFGVTTIGVFKGVTRFAS